MTISSLKSLPDIDCQIGQMLIAGFRDAELVQINPIVRDIREHHLGGVVLFDYDVAAHKGFRNIENNAQVKTLTESLNGLSSIPLFIGIDQEGGRVSRLKSERGFPDTVSQQTLGIADNPKLTSECAGAMAATLSQLGINLNFAPVVDLNTNPQNPVIGKLERSFSIDPEIVTRHALEVIKSHHRHGVLCCIKHFPGHGSSREDSHRGFVDVTDTWSSAELKPYELIIGAGCCDMVMTAHIFNSRLDGNYPATLSRSTIQGILRRQLNYQGLVISDDLQMKAISKRYGLETAVSLALEAGVDILLFGNNLVFDPDIVPRVIAVIKDLIKQGKIAEERIEQSYMRIARLKMSLCSKDV
jgi:beta-N-acetylhexosaminidase